MLLDNYIIYFFIFSFIGWIWETIYCTINSKQWANRGFLFGIVCPIYGVGAILCIIVVDALLKAFPNSFNWQYMFIICFFGSIVLEYFTSWILEKVFHAYWWDYSHLPLNIKGRVSLFTSFFFAIVGVVISFILYPFFRDLISNIPDIVIEIIGLFFVILFTSDLTLTISALTDFDKQVSEFDNTINEHMTELVESIHRRTSALYKSAITRVQGFRYPKANPIKLEKIQKLIQKIKLSK